MRRVVVSVSFRVLFFLSFACPITIAQTPTPTVERDPQAVAVLSQVLINAGGSSTLSAVQDISGSGSISYYQPESAIGQVTVRGTQLEQFRLDVALSSGSRSETMTDGQMSLKSEDGTISLLDVPVPLCPQCVILPYLLLAPAMSAPNFSLLYKGPEEIDGHSILQIEVQQVVSGLTDSIGEFRQYHTIDFFIDSTSYQIVAMRDTIPKHLVRWIRFSDFRSVNGVIIPFSIAEEVSGLQTWTIQLNQISLNSGLLEADFQL